MNLQLPLFPPESVWTPPSDLPAISGEIIAVDTETKDDSLNAKRGAGWAYGAGYICGVSVAWGGNAIYVPVRHPDSPECFDYSNVVRWLDFLYQNNTVVFQSAPYDLGWTQVDMGLKGPKIIHDTILMAQTLDENKFSYSLDNICKWLGILGKDESGLREAATAFGVDPKKGLWRLPARFVGAYAEQDARATLQAFHKMWKMLEQEQLIEPYGLDTALIPVTVEMRRRGIRIDRLRAEELAGRIERNRDALLQNLSWRLPIGRTITIDDIQSPKFLKQIFDMENIRYPRTDPTQGHPNGQPSFKSDWMEDHPHWLPSTIVKIDQCQMFSKKFLRGFILEFLHKERLHAEIHSYRNDDGGTRSSRFSYSNPPLQQIPARSEEGRIIRTCFLPEDGELWLKSDYSQQEYRLIVHYAALLNQRRADEAVAKYRLDPKTDFHKMVAEWTGLPRKRAKDTNFAKSFGAGRGKFALMTKLPKDEADVIYDKYDAELPFVSGAAQKTQSIASQRGYIKLLDGARSRFDFWEPAWREKGEPWEASLPLELAQQKWSDRRLKRSDTQKAFNRLIQGGAARQTKKSLRAVWNAGFCPLLQMHDELDFSIDQEFVINQIKDIMENVVKLEVPVIAETEVGLNWGSVKKRQQGTVESYFAVSTRKKALRSFPDGG